MIVGELVNWGLGTGDCGLTADCGLEIGDLSWIDNCSHQSPIPIPNSSAVPSNSPIHNQQSSINPHSPVPNPQLTNCPTACGSIRCLSNLWRAGLTLPWIEGGTGTIGVCSAAALEKTFTSGGVKDKASSRVASDCRRVVRARRAGHRRRPKKRSGEGRPRGQ